MAAAAFVTDLTEIATQVAEAAAGVAGVLSSFKLLDLANDYYKLYKDQRDFYYSTFQQGVEAPLAQEIYNDPLPVLDYVGRIATAYNSETGPFGGKSADMLGWWTRHRQAYGAFQDANLLKESVFDIARIKSDWTNYLSRFEETYYDLRSDVRWRKRIALHNIGIKEGTAVTSAMATSLGQYQDQISDFSSQMATYGNGIAKYVGYKRGLSDTSDDFSAMDYSRAGLAVPDYNYTQVGVAA
mgnify:CR=1 FL=1